MTVGLDAFWGDHVALHRWFGESLSVNPDWVDLDIESVRGLENPSGDWTNSVHWLSKEGYSDSEIRRVTGENTRRVLEEVWYGGTASLQGSTPRSVSGGRPRERGGLRASVRVPRWSRQSETGRSGHGVDEAGVGPEVDGPRRDSR